MMSLQIQFKSLFHMKCNLIHDFGDVYMLYFACLKTKCLTLFQETKTVTGKNNDRHAGFFSKCKPIETMGYIESMRIKDMNLR